MTTTSQRTIWDVLVVHMVTLGAVMLLWYTPISYPVRLFATLVHELGHLLATAFSGGTLYEIKVHASAAGHVAKLGGANWLIAPAGYLTTALVGSILLACCAQPERQKWALAVVCFALVGFAGVSASSIAVVVALSGLLCWILALLIAGWELMREITIRTLAIAVCVHALFDLGSLLTNFSGRRTFPLWKSPVPLPARDAFYTDATLMAHYYGGSEGMWALIYLIAGILVLVAGIVMSARAELASDEPARPGAISERVRRYRKGEGEYSIR